MPRLAERLQEHVPDGLVVLSLLRVHRRQMRTTNLIGCLNQEVCRPIRLVRVFVNEAPVERLVTGVLFEIEKAKESTRHPFISRGRQEEAQSATE